MALCGAEEYVVCTGSLPVLDLKLLSIFAILGGSATGVFLPLLAKKLLQNSGTKLTDQILSIAKSFGAGVILSTGFVHILPDAQKAFEHPCVPEHPWKSFPVHTCIAMLTALATLILEFISMSLFEHKSGVHFEEELQFRLPVVESESGDSKTTTTAASVTFQVKSGYDREEDDQFMRKVVISEVLELGIIAHSIIIGVTLGVSKNPCAIRTLLIALSCHQIFEGIALGSCICEARLSNVKSLIMACAFAVTAPLGISLGMAISSGYNENSASAMIVEGIFESASAGILIYLALVDLIAAEFLGGNRKQDGTVVIMSFFALFGGALAMSTLAIWA